MSERKHTDLPWAVRPNPMRSDGWFIDNANPTPMGVRNLDGVEYMQHDGITIVQVTNQANADFIVRACNSHYDLLEACKGLLPAAEFANLNQSPPGCYDPEIAAAAAAIAKATPQGE